MKKIEIINLSKSFGDNQVLDQINLDIHQGEIFTLLGPSGCGKTTLLRIIAGFETATAGDILLNGKSILNVPSEKRQIAMVFQNYSLFPNMNVYENVGYSLRIKKIPKAQIKEKVATILALVNLSGYENREIDQLSGGEQQRVAIARALIGEPQVLLLDEPLSNLDARLRENLRNQIQEIQQKLGITVIFVTHDQSEAMTLSHQIAVMNKGKVAQWDSGTKIYSRPANLFVATFVGDSNIFTSFELQEFGISKGHSNQLYLLRPENLLVKRDSGGLGRITKREHHGPLVRYNLEALGKTLITAQLFHESSLLQVGDSVSLAFDETQLVLLDSSQEQIQGGQQ